MTLHRSSSVLSHPSQLIENIEARWLPHRLLIGSPVVCKSLKTLSSPVLVGSLSSTPIPPVAPHRAPTRAVALGFSAIRWPAFPDRRGKYVTGQHQEPGYRLPPTAQPWDLNRCNTRGGRTLLPEVQPASCQRAKRPSVLRGLALGTVPQAALGPQPC
jgi:hypothetical protein